MDYSCFYNYFMGGKNCDNVYQFEINAGLYKKKYEALK